MGSWDLGAQWCAKNSSSQSGCLGIYRARICLIYKSVSLSLCTAVDCVRLGGAPQESNNQKGSRKIKQSKSHEYHFPIPLVFRIKTIKIPGKSR